MCTLEPQRECRHVTKLVPRLKPTENCVDVPKEVCVRNRVNPRRVQKPVIKKWCYTPTRESGLNGFGGLDNGSGRQGTGTPRPGRPQEPEGCVRGYPVDHCPRRSGNGRCDRECNTRRVYLQDNPHEEKHLLSLLLFLLLLLSVLVEILLLVMLWLLLMILLFFIFSVTASVG